MTRRNLFHILPRLCIALVILSLVVATLPPPLSVQAAPDIKDLVRAYEVSLGGSAEAQQQAAMALFRRYSEYKTLVVGGQVSNKTARALDERLVGMTQQIWRDVSVRHGAGLSHIVPVGTLGDRMNNPAYIPGKSDKDFIPRGSKASEAAKDFMEAFERKFGVPAASVDVNALDPTNISKWPDRVLAASNFEKYNTKGGIAWLERQMYDSKPTLWRFDSLTGKVEQVKFDRLVKTPPPSLNPEDAAGFLSDNMKFRQHLAEQFAGDPRALSLKQAKYDQRNVQAFILSGGELTQADKDMLKCTELMRNGHVDEAARMYARLIGETDPQKALLAYREAMESLTERMAKAVVEKHVTLIASGKLTQAGADELAAAIANMPQYRGMVEEAVTKGLGKAEWNEINKIAQAFGERVSAARFGVEYFNEQAMKYFGRPYDKLSDAQRAILHGAEEAAETSGVSVGRILGTGLSAAFSAWAIHSSYTEGAKQGTATGIAHAVGRTAIELLQLGYPPAQIAELVGLVAAGLINYGASEYKNSVLDALYASYKANPSDTTLNDLLETQSILSYYAGGIREFAKSLRMDEANLTDDQIRQKLREYLVSRLEADKVQERVADIERWIEANDIPLLPGGDWISALGDNRDLKAKNQATYYRLIGAMLAAYDDWAVRLRADGIPFTDATIKHILFLMYRGTPEDLTKFLEELYAKSPTPCKLSVGDGQLGRIISARDAVLNQATPSRGGAIAKPQVLVNASGAFAVPKDPNAPCGPSRQFGPFEVASGGTISATVDGDPPVPNEWSLYNNNTSVVVYFEPKVGQGYRAGHNLLPLVGQASDSHLRGTADWSGPGRMWITIGAPSGAGPLKGGCFEQSYSARVSIESIKPDSPALPDDRLLPGDQLITGPNGEVVVQLPDCSKLLVKPNSVLTFSNPKPGVVQVHVTKGGFRLQRPPRGVHGLQVKLGNQIAKPVGTEFEVDVSDAGETIAVIDGAVAVGPEGGEEVRVEAGQRAQWPGGQITPYDAASEPNKDAGLVAGLPLSQVLTDDGTPEPYGPKTAEFADGKIPVDWVWQDPGSDIQIETPEVGALRLTVPDGNQLWDARSDAGRLLHKVTGDFDLEGEVRLDCAGTDMSSVEFLLYSPGSAFGELAGQMRGDDPVSNYRIMGGGWYRGIGVNKLLKLGQSWQASVDAPAEGPVRLRLTRRGDLWKTYWSRDGGATWILSWREELTAPDTVWVGWLFMRNAWDGLHDQPATATLRDVRLVSAPRSELPGAVWDVTSPDGSAFVEGERTLAVSMDSSTVGFAGLQSAAPLTGDFDVVARFEVTPRQPGESRYVQLAAKTADDKQIAVALLLENDSVQSTLVTNIMRDGGWLGEKRQPTYDTTRLRIARRSDHVVTYRWEDCGWTPMTDYEAILPGPMYLVLGAGNDWDKIPSPVKARWTVEQITAEESPFGADWAPVTCSILSPSDPPPGMQIPPGVRSQWFTAPFALGNLFFAPDGTAYVFSNDQGKQELLAVTPDGEARPYAMSELLAGVNGKSGAWIDGKLLVSLDYWPGGGNPLGGLFWLSPDGSFTEWKLSATHGGILDVIPAPGGGIYLADVENDGVWRIPAEGGPEQQMIAQDNMLTGAGVLAYDQAARVMYALNWTGDSPFGGQAGVYRITEDGKAELIATPPVSVNFGGLALSPGGTFPAGLYVSEPDAGQILRIDAPGALTPVVTGLPKPGAIRFNPTTGDLWVVCDGKAIWVGSSQSRAIETTAQPAAAEATAPAQWGGFFGSDETPVVQLSPTTEAGGFFGGEATPEPEPTEPTTQQEPIVQPTAQGEPPAQPEPTVALPLPTEQPGIAAFTASALEAQSGEWVTLSWRTSGGQPRLFRLDAAGQPKPESSDYLIANGSMDVPIEGEIGEGVTFVLGLLSPLGNEWLATASVTVQVTGAVILPTPEPESVGAYWAGAWETDWGVMTLQVSGDQVTGNYPHDEGRVQGTLSPDGWTLEGTWSEAPSFQPPDDAGRFIFTLAQDKQSWSGKWGYGDSANYGDWTGARVPQSPAPSSQPALGPFTFSSDFDEATGRPSNVGQVFATGTPMIWVSWPYSNFPTGTKYTFEWYHDGQLFEQGQNQFWNLSGLTWEWVGGQDHSPLPAGAYTFVLYINGQRYEIGSVLIQ